ncbi:MAG: UDP-3-O-(3-hydroxymyristoyl)glucosamine N-acyltransferase [Candidatus Krumholzibacteria bacterium]|nr:UDP-3-O-(3-hydroxymyristoyl)glucosamine N-acyltransferase [Candidatus Krumholzibacteria bacterium]
MEALRLSEVAVLVDGELVGAEDPEITGVAGLEDAGPGDLTFVGRKKLNKVLAASGATAVIVGPDQEVDRPAIRVKDPYGAFAAFLERLLPDPDRLFPPGIHPTAVIDPTAEVDKVVAIGPYSVVGAGCVIGAGSRLGAHVILGCDILVGRDCLLHSGATVREGCLLGDRVIVHSGAVLGSDGFGYLTTKDGIHKIPQVGVVEIHDDVEIGAGCCVDRATTGRTIVGTGSKIDNLVQIGHNVRLGEHCSLSAQTGIAGSCTLGDGVFCGGQVGIADHIGIGAGVKIGGQSGIINDVPAGKSVFGYPALDLKESFRMFASLRRLPELFRRVRLLEQNPGRSAEVTGKDQE